MRLVWASLALVAMHASASAQLTTTPGPGGIPIAPGVAPRGFTPGGTGFGGVEISPGPAARGTPMYREGPGGVPVLVVPEKKRQGRGGRRKRSDLQPEPDCGGAVSCVPQDLQLTVNRGGGEPGRPPAPGTTINSIRELFAALNACWEPPARDEMATGMQMSVRFSFNRTGHPLAPPFVTYSTRGVPAETKQVFRKAIDAALERCGNLSFSKQFGAAIAGRPISARFVDDRAGAGKPQ